MRSLIGPCNHPGRNFVINCVEERDFEGFEEAATIVDESVSISMSMDLEVDGANMRELVNDHSEELTTEKFFELKSEDEGNTEVL